MDGTPSVEPTAAATDLVRKVIEAGERLSPKVRDRILGLGAAAVPPLIQLLEDAEFASEDSPGEGWGPVHAAGLLGDLRATEAVAPMLRLLAATGWDDYLHDRIILALGEMGSAALERALRAYTDNPDREFRVSVSGVLACLGIKDERIFEILIFGLKRDPLMGATNLAQYGDPRAIPHLLRVFDEYEIESGPYGNQALLDLGDAIEALGGSLAQGQQAKLAQALRVRKAGRAPAPFKPRCGRNEPCWCGSLKKYKKCHLVPDQDAHRAGPMVPGPALPLDAIVEITVTLRDIAPPVWRRLRVPAAATLSELHAILQRAMGWSDDHLHDFEIAGARYGVPDDETHTDEKEEGNVTLAQVARAGGSFVYRYDFGDNWEHVVQVEKVLPPGADSPAPKCIAGQRACPPEDCGGVPGYALLLEVLADPAHEQRENVPWARDFDPAAFDVDAVNKSLGVRRS